ncbi:MAG TPA: MFS transporter [Jatrophihabitantaceae bacterium]|nr:MFS transporter [Jatrophihabitantaceae bacterium]
MPPRGHLRTSIADAGFRRLFAVRLLGQFGDGIFQASLAGVVLFNPERQAHAADVAAGFAVVLIPYSVIGPFAGVLLDRWRRQRVLVWANLLRTAWIAVVAVEIAAGVSGVAFYASALVIVSISRFVLSALSASLPHVVSPDNLVTVNALSTTVGGITATIGGAAAIGVRSIIGSSGGDYAMLSLAAGLTYLIAASPGRGFDADALGPDDTERERRETVSEVARGLVAGARYLRAHRAAFAALSAIAVHRVAYGVTVVCTLLLYRNYFHSSGVLRAGLGGLAQVVGAVAIGGGIAALVTPAAARRFGYVSWPALLLLVGAAVQIGLGLPYRLSLLLLDALVLGFVAQGIKICVDTIVQRDIDDAYRGRVFAIYDAIFNVTLVVAAVLTAAVLPQNGHSPTSVVVIGVAYALTAVGYRHWAGSRLSPALAQTTG